MAALCLLLVSSAVPAGTVTFTYDALGRLRTVTNSGGVEVSYTLDAAGNRTATTFVNPAGVVSFAVLNDTALEAVGTKNIVLNRTGGTAGAAVRFALSGTATRGTCGTPGVDYAVAGVDASGFGTVVFGATDTSKAIAVQICPDAVPEATESISVLLVWGAAFPSTPYSGSLAIQDVPDTQPPSVPTGLLVQSVSSSSLTIGWSAATDLPSPGGAGVAGYRVLRASSAAGPYAQRGSTAATQFVDSGLSPATTYHYKVTAYDAAVPANESAPQAVPLTATTSGGGGGAPGTLRFSAPQFYATEQSQLMTVVVQRVGGTAGSVSVNYLTGDYNSAVAYQDFTPVSGTLSWSSGDAADKTISIPITWDSVNPENAEYFDVHLTGPVGTTVDAPSIISVTILNSTPPSGSPGTIRFSAPQFYATEQSLTMYVTVQRVGGSTGPVSVSYLTGDYNNAVAYVDFVPVSGTLSWASGDAADKVIQIPIIWDAVNPENPEYFDVHLNSPVGTTIDSPSIISVTILNSPP